MYNLIIYLYLLGVAVYSRFNTKVRRMWRGERDAFRVLREKVDPQARYVWFHAASLGEFEQGRPLMEQMRRDHPDIKILLTFFSPSGYEVRKNYEGADIICYLPVDTPLNARRFLKRINPEKAFFIKYEFWYNYLHILKRRGIPVYSVSSIFREGQVFFRWYGRQYGRVLKCFTHFYVQNEESRSLLGRLGLTNVTVTGDTRFDRVLQIKEQAKRIDEVEQFLQANHGKKVFVVGSSWEQDEDVYLPYFSAHKDWLLIIAPHVASSERIKLLQERLNTMKLQAATLKELGRIVYDKGDSRYGPSAINKPAVLAGIHTLIIDCYGLLSSIYRYADVTYVGGGFGVGIHNTLEAAVWDVPVIFGPNNHKFQEAQGLKARGGGFEIACNEDFRRLMDRFATDADSLATAGRQAGDYVGRLSGATSRILADVPF